MITYPEISPEIVSLGPIKIRWYGLMYVIGFYLGYQVLRWRARQGLFKANYLEVESYVTHLIVGMLIGARVVYALVYDWADFSQDPMKIFYVWQGGLSFHGAMIGMVSSSAWFGYKKKLPFYMVTDSFAMAATPGLFFGRMGNFINAELYGRPTDVPWAMIFPTDPDKIPRHPSQLYQAFTEGVLLLGILLLAQKIALKNNRYRLGLLSWVFLAGYGTIRFLIEFTRQPDSQLGFVLGPFSMGQLLCALMWVWAAFVFVQIRKRPVFTPKPPTRDFLEATG